MTPASDSAKRDGFFAGETAFAIMERNRGAGPGFDLWRVGLSVMVILVHSFAVVYSDAGFVATGPFGPVVSWVLPIFFGLSGFLVTGSAMRTRSVKVFLAYRGLRIVPALVTEVTLAALVLGPLVTTLPLGQYFSDPKFLTYFGNIVGWIHFELPGVFENNARPNMVNQNLWTLHPEFQCYAMMALLMFTRIIYNRQVITWFLVIVTVIAAVMNVFFDRFELKGNYAGPVLVYAFLCGVVAFHHRERIIINKWLFVISVLLAYILPRFEHTTFLVQPFLIYMMIYVGMLKFPRVDFLQRGDYSYGMYLYAYPVQQTLVLWFPAVREWYFVFGLTIVISFGIAAISWHLIEKPALKLKRHVSGQPRVIASATEPQR